MPTRAEVIDQARRSVVANAIGYALFAKEGEQSVAIDDEWLEKIKKAADRVIDQLDEFDEM